MAASEEERHLALTGDFDCDPSPLSTLRHSTSHVMAQAVKRLHPEVKMAIGPAIEDGFYYDFDRSTPFTTDDLARIEATMREIANADYPFERREMGRDDAIAFFRERGERFKVEILERIVAPGAPFWLPNGMILVRELEKFARESLDTHGYQEIATPLLVNKKLWEQSGHWEHYEVNMFKVEVEGEIYSLKPMNCPESTFVYRRALRSYRDLPLRLSEMGRCHRNERSGTLTGLVRVRQFTQDDAHIYCRPDQLQDEITALLGLVREWYKVFTLEPSFKLSTRPEKYLGTREQWDDAERALSEALRANGIAYELNAGDGAFYGPKIDVDVHDVLGRQWQIATIQADLTMLPERFQLEYIDADGQPKRPVAIHRAIFGSYKRFIGILTEHYAGAFPTWLAPVQARVLPISEKHAEYARSVWERLRGARIRADLDDRNEKLGYRIRDAQVRKVPYMLVVGERERAAGTVSLRPRTGEDVGTVPLDRVVGDLTREIAVRAPDLTVGRS